MPDMYDVPPVTICIPHLHTDTGRRALYRCLQSVAETTEGNYDLMVAAHSVIGGNHNDIYVWANDMAARARTDWLLLLCTDQYLEPGWDTRLLDIAEPGALYVLRQCESNYMGVHERHTAQCFGMTPETFDDTAFAKWAAEQTHDVAENTYQGMAWSLPWFVDRRAFLDAGGLRTVYPEHLQASNDMYFVGDWLAAQRPCYYAPAWCYHLMAWSLTGETR